LTEYGLEDVNSEFAKNCHAENVEAVRWLAPEIVESSAKLGVDESKVADVFAFGMVGVEVFTGRIPFDGYSAITALINIRGGVRPERPGEVELKDEMWNLLKRCWDQDPKKRPTIREVVGELEGFVGGATELGSDPQQDSNTEGAVQAFARTFSELDAIADAARNSTNEEEILKVLNMFDQV
jgi:serine/threonine protein kinase